MENTSQARFSWTNFRFLLAAIGFSFWGLFFAMVCQPAFAKPVVEVSAATAINTVRLGNWPDKTRLVLEGPSAMHAEVDSRSTATELSVTFTFPVEHDLSDWLDRIIPRRHADVRSVQILSLQETSAEVRFHFNSPVSLHIFNLRPMEGHESRLVLDFYDLAAVRNDQWLDVYINQLGGFGTVFAVTTRNHDTLMAGSDLQRWRVELPQTPYVTIYDEPYYSLRQLGISYQINPRLLQIHIQIPAAQFTLVQRQGYQRTPPELTRSSLGGFFNYDISALERNNDLSASAVFEAGVFNRWGSGSHRVLARNESDYHDQGVIRLDTQWRYDNPKTMTTLIVGDSINRASSWSRTLRFSGLQWGTNFSTQPEMLTTPTLAFVGEASQPSTVDLFINDALRFRTEVPTGPFTIDELPTISGYGEARMVITDILGREQIIQQNYISNRRLLRAGLQDFSVELGYLRHNYGLHSNDYGAALVSGLHRFGLTNTITSELHLQATPEQQVVGAGAAFALPANNLFHIAFAGSQSEGKSGQLVNTGFQHQRRRFNVGIDAEVASVDFKRVGTSSFNLVPRLQLRAFSSYSAGSRGTFSLSYTEQDYRNRARLAFLNAGYSVQLAKYANLRFTALHYLDNDDTRFNLTLNIPLGRNRTNASLVAQSRGQHTSGYAQVQRSVPSGTGFGYRLRHGLSARDLSLASVQYQNDHARYTMDVSQRQGVTATRAGLRGAFTLMHGQLSASRQLNRSFALVQLPDFPNVRIYADNQPVGRTDAQGNAMIPRLRPYQRNRIRIEQADLPMNANIDSLEQEVSPYYRSGIKVEFPVRLSRDALFRIVLPDGESVPVGAQAVSKSGTQFMVGHRGEVYMMDMTERSEVTVRWGAHRCSFTLTIPQSDDPLPDLGSVTCTP